VTPATGARPLEPKARPVNVALAAANRDSEGANSTAGPATPARHFRADIQALRAIAVLMVVIYHVRPERLPGGFVGVDVFFVISGFLITSHLIRDATRSGRVKLGAFWAARARRILPASLVAIVATVGLTAWLAPVTMFETLQRQALASIFYVQNWVLAGDAVDYSAADNTATAFQHFWSLSVEEQFYLIWPLLVLLAAWFVGRDAVRPGTPGYGPRVRRTLLVLFGVVVAASLAYSIYAVQDAQADAYFVTTTRIWELGAGGLLATVSIRRLSRAARYVLGYAGLAAIAGSALLLSSQTPFPGMAALPVILGTVAVILAGTPAEGESDVALAKYDPWTFASRLRISQWFGDRSYSLYLWHFPVIVIWTMVADRTVDYLDLIGMIVVSIGLAHFSYRYIEQPTRRAPLLTGPSRRTLLISGTSMLVVAAITFAYPWAMNRAQADGDWSALALRVVEMPVIGAETAHDGALPTFVTSTAEIAPSPLDAERDRNLAFEADTCVAEQTDEHTPNCTAGDPDAELSVVLVGDSHVRMYSTALAQLALDDGWFLRIYTHDACPFSPTPREIEVAGELTCTEPNAAVMHEILDNPPDLVITSWYQMSTFIDDGSPSVPGAAGFAQYWNTMEDAGIPVLVLRDSPRMQEDVPDCIAQWYETPDKCAVPRDEAFPGPPVLDEATQLAPRVSVADFTDAFCTDELCKPVIGNVIVYTDVHHLTDTFTMTMIPRLREAIDAALAER